MLLCSSQSPYHAWKWSLLLSTAAASKIAHVEYDNAENNIYSGEVSEGSWTVHKQEGFRPIKPDQRKEATCEPLELHLTGFCNFACVCLLASQVELHFSFTKCLCHNTSLTHVARAVVILSVNLRTLCWACAFLGCVCVVQFGLCSQRSSMI